MRRVDDDALVAWLRDRAEIDGLTGIDATGWPASTWILNSMYERADLPSGLTHYDVYQMGMAAGDAPTGPLGDISKFAVYSGAGVGWAPRPGPEWSRLRWSELADRLGVRLGGPKPPTSRWFPFRSWPANPRSAHRGFTR